MKTNLTKTHDIDAAYKEFDFTDVAKKYQDAGTKYCFDALEGRIMAGYNNPQSPNFLKIDKGKK